MKAPRHNSPTEVSGWAADGPPAWATHLGTLALVAAFAWYFVYLRYWFNTEFPLATPAALADGSAYKPFQFRALAPWIASLIRSTGIADLTTAYQWIEGVSVVGLYYSFRFLLSETSSRQVSGVLSFAVFYVLPWNYLLPRGIPILLPYDLPAVMFFTLGLALLRRRIWWWYYAVLAVGSLNRETMVFLAIVLFATDAGRSSRRAMGLHLAGHAVVWIGVRLLMTSLYGGNPGNAFELYHVGTQVPHIKTNLELLIAPQHLLLILSNFGFAWILVAAFWKRIGDQFTRRALWVLPPYVLLTFIAGNMNEIRVFGELMPLILVPALLIVMNLIRVKPRLSSSAS